MGQIYISVRRWHFQDEEILTGLLEYIHTDKKFKTLTDSAEMIELAVYLAAVERNSVLLKIILKWRQKKQSKKFTHKSKAYVGTQGFVIEYSKI